MDEIIFVTSALPYANGDLHIGHLLEFVQTDIWVRYNRQIGNKCLYISGIDSHGTPIMLKSYSEKISFESLINKYFLSHKFDLQNFLISIDNYYTTHSYENELFSKRIFRKLFERGYIFTKHIDQLYDVVYDMFLPDRYVIGSCPNCSFSDQHGDVCEKCSFRYDAKDLVNPISVLSNCKPIKKQSLHFFFDLKKFQYFLLNLNFSAKFQKSVVNKLKEWLNSDLKEWDISRDNPYFGFKFPGEYSKYFYVWLDAPIGYMSIILNYFLKNGLMYSSEFVKLKNFVFYHFIGKDIMYFHALFWPSILHGINFNPSYNLHVHGFLTIDGLKMSKSKNLTVAAKSFVSKFNSDCLRFYFASKLTSNIVDIDFSFEDFSRKVNSDLIGKFLNIISRCSKIIIDNYNSALSFSIDDTCLFNEYLNVKNILAPFYKSYNYSRVIFYIIRYAEKINSYLDKEKPWILVKSKKTFEKAHIICTTAINLFLLLLLNFEPILPDLCNKIKWSLGFNDLSLDIFINPILGVKILSYNHFITKI